jgi:hypothetical protein
LSANAFTAPLAPSSHTLEFKHGVPVALDGEELQPVALIESLEVLAGSYGIGRGIHLGDTVLGTKGRVAFEAPAAITLITAHRELEKLVLSGQQMRIKDSVSAIYGDLVHEGKQLDLACDDVEALLTSSQLGCDPDTCSSKEQRHRIHCSLRQKASMANRPANGRPVTRWVTRAFCRYPDRCKPERPETDMKNVVVDKLASVAQHNDLTAELRLSADIPCEEGVLIAVRVLNNKSRYNQLELTSGRMATVTMGDIIVGALGHRNALRGYSGHLPKKLSKGDRVQILNVGGVIGICDSANPDVGAPFECEVLGTVLEFPFLGERIGVPNSSPMVYRSLRLRVLAWIPVRPLPLARSSADCVIWV